jgi:hypothetical protein
MIDKILCFIFTKEELDAHLLIDLIRSLFVSSIWICFYFIKSFQIRLRNRSIDRINIMMLSSSFSMSLPELQCQLIKE